MKTKIDWEKWAGTPDHIVGEHYGVSTKTILRDRQRKGIPACQRGGGNRGGGAPKKHFGDVTSITVANVPKPLKVLIHKDHKRNGLTMRDWMIEAVEAKLKKGDKSRN